MRFWHWLLIAAIVATLVAATITYSLRARDPGARVSCHDHIAGPHDHTPPVCEK